MVLVVAVLIVGYLMLHSSAAPGAPGLLSSLSLSLSDLPLGETWAPIGPDSDPSRWVGGKPGSVTIGGQEAPEGWNPGNMGTATKAAGYAVTGISAAMGTASAMGSSVFAASGALSAVPFVGVAIAVVGTVLGVIAAHHAAALAAEGKALNDADPRMVNAMVMVLQAVLYGEIFDAATAEAHLATIVADWNAEVKSIQRGTWPYHMNVAGPNHPDSAPDDVTLTYENSYLSASKAPHQQYHAWKPDPCNAACVISHYFVQRNAIVVSLAVRAALAGEHGVMVLPTIPPHDTQLGFPEVRVAY